jgi:outer membrane protein assembly factor BamB
MKNLRLWVIVVCWLPWGINLPAADWPEWRGPGRVGVWSETGIVETFPATGLKFRWRVPIRGGYAGPAVAQGRVFVTDFTPTQFPAGTERALCLDEKTGRVLWRQSWETDYRDLQPIYAIGPRATPTVDGDRVYVLGAEGVLSCFEAATGALRWRRDFIKEYRTQVPVWGMAGAPLVDGDRLICLVGGQPDAKVVAFDKHTGKELWRALDEGGEPGYGQPILLEASGTRQVILWTPQALVSLDPVTGKVYWREPFVVRSGLTVATPVVSGNRLLVSAFYNGSLMMELDASGPAARVLWRGRSNSEQNTDGLHALISTPVLAGDHLYGVCSYGQFRCLDARTGERVWETLELTRERARWATAFLVRHGDRYFINNDRGELIIARLSPGGYEEISRTALIRPTSRGGRRELGAVHWSHPAYANRHIFTRNDEEIVCASLAAADYVAAGR